MKRDVALEFQQQRQIWRRIQQRGVSWGVKGSDMETEPHVKVIVTDVGLSPKMSSSLSNISDWRAEHIAFETKD